MRKVAILTNTLGCGGAERTISRIYPRLSENCQVSVMLLDGSALDFADGIDPIVLGKGESRNRFLYGLSILHRALRFKRYIKEQQIECVISFLTVPNIINILFNKRGYSIISIRGQLKTESGLATVIKQRLSRRLYRRADRIIVPSEALKNSVVKETGIDSNKCEVIYNPFNAEEIRMLSEGPIPDEYEDLFNDNRVVIALGRMTYEKGYCHLLYSFRNVLQTHKEVKLVIIGDGDLYDEIGSKVKELGIEDDVILMGKINDPFPYLKRACLYVLSSVSEGFPNAMVEGMICGLPVVSTDCKSGPREILSSDTDVSYECEDIEQAEYGILTPCFKGGEDNAERYDLMARAISSILDDEKLHDQYSIRSLERGKEFTVGRAVDSYLHILGSNNG